MNRRLVGILCTVLSAVIFGSGPLVTNIIYSAGGTPVTVLALRSFAVPVLLAVFYNRRDWSLRTTKTEFKKLFLLGTIGSTGTPLLLLNAYRWIPSGTVTTIHYIYCVLVVLAGVILFHERMRARTFVCVILCVLGMVLLYTPQLSGGALGFLCAIGSSFTYAFYVIYMERSNLKAINPLKLQFYTISIRFLWTCLYAALSGGFHLSLTTFAWITGLLYYSGIGLIAVLLFQLGVRYSGASSAAIFSTFEPLTSVVIGILVLGEPFGIKTALGIVSILIATILLVVLTKNELVPEEIPEQGINE